MAETIVFKIPMDIEEIKKCIPHRYPFLLVDRVSELKVLDIIRAEKAVSYSDPILQGHFPGNPIFPGVMIIEALAQCAAILGHCSSQTGLTSCFLTEVGETRFRRPVVPGDVIHLEAHLKKHRVPFYWFEGKAFVKNTEGEHLVASTHFSAQMR